MIALVDLVIAVLALETIVLTAYHVMTGKGISPRRLLPMLGAGLFLIVAVRLALTGAGLAAIGLCLMLAGLAHAADVALRWQDKR